MKSARNHTIFTIFFQYLQAGMSLRHSRKKIGNTNITHHRDTEGTEGLLFSPDLPTLDRAKQLSPPGSCRIFNGECGNWSCV